ncbi:ferrichrome porin FhuA [Leclercia pneumoniae]|uniref:ferrichrome porin FhuA n=1 Tax=Leclercia pneumoniae TaxID=2815358 RepID=UPI0021E5449F|nr:ferrichrome porin FhuA [Leclercia pneumoniae]MCV2513987.1 ferrichrome porin FhuA [Leclercia pneumoniae]WNN81924.1 ferrichrome porin FhuA [Leclercia pneumoniae]
MALSKTAQPINYSLRKIAVVVATAVSGMSAYAQAAETPKKEETITVTAAPAPQESAWGPAATIAAKHSATATKTDTPIEKTPQSVSVVTRAEMDTRQPSSVKEALAYTPGAAVSTRGSSTSYDFVIIRGFYTPGPTPNNYLDGIKLQGDYYSAAVVDPYMLERVEMMRGPTSVLYGKSNPGGLISMVSKSPTSEPLKEIQFKMGTDNLFQTGFDFSDSLDDDGIYSYRLTGLARSNDQQQDFSKQKRYAIAPVFSWKPDDKTNLTLRANIQNDPSMGYYGWLPKEGTVEPLPDGSRVPVNFTDYAPNNTYSRYQRMVGYSFEHSFDDTFTVRQNLRYSQIKTSQQSVYGFGATGNQLTRSIIVSDERYNDFGVDTQLESKFGTGEVAHTLLTGIDYSRLHNDIDNAYGTAPTLDMNDPVYTDVDFPDAQPFQLNTQHQTGLYVQDQLEWEKWVATLGGRYDWSKQATTIRSSGQKVERNDEQFTWRAGINYLFDNGITPYFSYSESFEPNPSKAWAATPADNVAYAPSKGKQYEAGVKYIPKELPVVVTAAVYELTKTNNLTTDPTNPFAQVAAGEVRSRGVELEAKAAVNANINLTASYTYTDAEYTDDTTYKGLTPVQVPKNMASLWGDYTFYEGALSGLTLGTGGRYVGSSYGDPDNTFKVGSSTVMDAVVKYDLARLGLAGSSVAVNVNNLFDREYVASCFNTYGCFWGAERQVVATATFRF